MVLGFLGGYINVVYVGFCVLTWWYRDFNLDQSLIKRIYSQDGRDTEAEPHFDEALDLFKHRVDNRKQFLMDFNRYCCSQILLKFFCLCCCLNKSKCLRERQKELHQRDELLSRLNLEIDLVEIVKRARLTKLMAKIGLSKF